MVCPECTAELEERQRFCRICGAEVMSITGADGDPDLEADPDVDPNVDPVLDADPDPDSETTDPDSETGEADGDITVPILYDLAADPTMDAGAHQPAAVSRANVGVVVILGGLTGVVALIGMLPRLVSIRTDNTAPTFATGDWLVADLGTNLPGALIVALVALLVGLVGAMFRQRWGYGLAGGSGLAITGWVALTIGMVERPVQTALLAAERPASTAFTVTITRDIGYGLLVAAAVGGLLTFVASLARAGHDGRRSLNPWVAALGALAAVVAAAGPLLPEGTAALQDNWMFTDGSAERPLAFVVGRLIQLGALAASGVVGFLLVRRYGLGLAIGGLTASGWLVITTLLDLSGQPIGPGLTNPGSDPLAPDLHSVTTTGTAALALFAIIGVIAAYDQAAREP